MDEKSDNRFLIFCYDTYYPLGGLSDMKESFNTIEEARAFIKFETSEHHEIYDRKLGLEVD